MIDLDFIPPQYHATRSIKGAIRLRASLIVTMLVFMVLWSFANEKRVSSAKAMVSDVLITEQQVNAHAAKKAEMEAEYARLQDGQSLLKLLESKASPVVVLSDVSRRITESVFLTEVKMMTPSASRYARDEDRPAATTTQAPTPQTTPPAEPASSAKSAEPVPRVPQIIISGLAVETPDVIQFSALLEDSPLIARVQMELKGSVVWAGRRGQGFKMTCDLHPQTRSQQ